MTTQVIKAIKSFINHRNCEVADSMSTI